MIFSLRKGLQLFKYLLMFIVLTFFLYHIMTIVSGWMEPTHKYKQPAGRSVKVFGNEGVDDAHIPMKDRLMLFYWYGE
ncbi:DUF4227 family protein [Paenibacillus contaminans]|jgi:hypothetical protein|uniref:DUF4227 domain-containing protein n=1 Tax=Paenibacillus contaminans TaxID=450362 RepID=A0A329MIK8_9BACL|nr:DUF4227 family protein [Paenibacillus contaminans]RAV18613.1 DUF4227 domain-containing protein [Paenibacillus contaminans]